MTNLAYNFTIQNRSLCICSTSNDLYLAGENHQCENTARFPVPNELKEYLVGGLVCKEHLRYLLEKDDKNPSLHNWESWIASFKSMGVPKGNRIEDLQQLYKRQAIWSEMS